MDEFADIYEKLNKQCRYYSQHLGHLKALIENDDWMRVVDGSMSGRSLLLGNSEITIPQLRQNPKFVVVDDPEVIGHLIAE